MPDTMVCIGECMVEMAPRADGAYAMGFAGDTFNTAWYARQRFGAGWSVSYFTGAGEDAVSSRMLSFMKDAGIGTEHVVRVPGKTVGLYLIELANGERSFAYWRSDSAAKRLADDPKLLAAALAGVRVAYFSGITLAILAGEARAVLLDQLAAARAAGATIVFDPNLRPRLWPSPAAMCAAVEEAARIADIVLPSFDDEASFFGDADTAATAARYAGLGARTVMVKNGSGEMLCLHEGRTETATPPPADEVVDTTAAGDSFNAAFLERLLSGASCREAMNAGAMVAREVIGQRGALVKLGQAR